jgi:hypothetical protein
VKKAFVFRMVISELAAVLVAASATRTGLNEEHIRTKSGALSATPPFTSAQHPSTKALCC